MPFAFARSVWACRVSETSRIGSNPALIAATWRPTATFAVAVNRTWVNRQSAERQEATSFIDVVAWGTLAENAAASLAQGNRVLVTGRLDQRWDTEAGERRSKVEVSAEDLAPPALGHGQAGPDGAPGGRGDPWTAGAQRLRP
jgi:single stranded DNA-binding protein